MKVLSRIGLVLLSIVLLIVVFGLFQPSEVNVSRSGLVKASPEVTFGLVNNMKSWELWSPWHNIDPKMTIEYGGPADGVGAWYQWKSQNPQVGNGKLTITGSQPSTSITTHMDFDDGGGDAFYTFTPVEGGTQVTWAMKTDMGSNPFMRILGLFFDGMVGPDFERGLANLNHVADSVSKLQATNPATSEIKIVESSVPARTAYLVKNKCTMAEIEQRLGLSYGGIMKTMQEQGLKSAGAPFAIYYTDGANGTFEFEAGMTIAGDKTGKDVDAVKFTKLPASKVVVADFYGPYDQTGKAHAAIDTYLKEKGLTATGAPWEEYVSDPMLEKDINKVLTKVYYPVK